MARKKRKYFVADTNVILDYIDIIPNGKPLVLDKPSVDLAGHCLVIPAAVVKELDKFKNEQSDRGHAAREALRRLDAITQRVAVNIKDVNTLNSPIMVESGGYSIQVLPVDYRFCNAVSFRPVSNDMDGQIILATLAALCSASGQPVDGNHVELDKLKKDTVVLLTNDRGMAIRARSQGITAMQFRYSIPTPHTGRRDLAVPDKLFLKFFSEGKLPNEEWQQAMPGEKPLVTNEYIIMRPESGSYPEAFEREKFLHVGKFNAETKKIERLKYWERAPVVPLNEGQAIFNDALADPNITCVICTGPAGTGKTYQSTVYGWDACQKHRFDGVVVVPCDPENSNRLGALPGDLDSKMDPSVRPHKNALENYFLANKGRYSSSCFNNPSVTTEDPDVRENRTDDKKADDSSATANSSSVGKKQISDEEPGSLALHLEPQEQSEEEPSVATGHASTIGGAAAKKANSKSSASNKPRHSKYDSDHKKDKKDKKSFLSQVDEEVDDVWNAWFRNIPIYLARGLSFPSRLVLYDEFQDQSRSQAETLLTRKGIGAKMVITGDIEQIHSAYLDRDNNGLTYARQLLKGHPLVAQITFLPSEVVRDPLVRFIIENKTAQAKELNS